MAERSLSSAENYLEQLTAIEGNTEQLRDLRETLSGHRDAIEENTQRIELREIPDSGGGQPVDMEGFADTLTRMQIGNASWRADAWRAKQASTWYRRCSPVEAQPVRRHPR